MGKTLQPTDIMIRPEPRVPTYKPLARISDFKPPDERKTLAERLYYQEDLESRAYLVIVAFKGLLCILQKSYSGYGLSPKVI